MPEASITSVLDCSSMFHSLWRDEAAIGISDTEKYLAYIDGKKMKLGIKPGDPVKKGSILDGVLSENKTVIRRVGKEVFGIPYIGIGLPVIEKGRVTGALAVVMPLEKQEELHRMATVIKEVIDVVHGQHNQFNGLL